MTAPNSKLPRRCPWCSSEATLWLRQPPDYWHVFRVECRDSHHFLKWGTEGQFEEARRRGLDVLEVPFFEASSYVPTSQGRRINS